MWIRRRNKRKKHKNKRPLYKQKNLTISSKVLSDRTRN